MIDPNYVRELGTAAREAGIRHLQVKTPEGAVLVIELEPKFDGELVEPPTDPGGWKRSPFEDQE